MMIVLGPSVGSVARINNIYYFQIIIKYRDKDKILSILNDLQLICEDNKKIKLDVDINPNSL